MAEYPNPAPDNGSPTTPAVATPPPVESMGQSAVKGVFWVGAGQAIKQIIAIGTSITLARLLAPGDFGVFAMVFFAIELAQVFTDFSFGAAIIQRRVTDAPTLSSVFWLSMGVALLAATLLSLAGPLLAEYFRQPILVPLALVGALNILIACALVVPQALLSQRFEFRAQIQAQLFGSITGAAAALFAAFSGAGVWSLVIQPIVGTLVALTLMLRAAHWLPRLNFKYAEVRDMVRFGSHLLASNVIDTLGRNLHNIILGRTLGPAPLGLYNMAHGVTYFPIYQISAVVVRVLFPTLVNLRDDAHRMKAAYLRIVGAIALLTFPCMTGLFAVADDFVLLVFGEKWMGMVPALKVISLVVMCQSVATTATTVLLSKGYTHILLKFSMVSTVLIGVGLLIGSRWGLQGTAMGWGAAAIINYAMIIYFSMRKIDTSFWEFLAVIRGPFLAASIMGGIVIVIVEQLSASSPALRLGTGIAAGALAYALLTLIFNRQDAKAVWKLLHTTWVKKRQTAKNQPS